VYYRWLPLLHTLFESNTLELTIWPFQEGSGRGKRPLDNAHHAGIYLHGVYSNTLLLLSQSTRCSDNSKYQLFRTYFFRSATGGLTVGLRLTVSAGLSISVGACGRDLVVRRVVITASGQDCFRGWSGGGRADSGIDFCSGTGVRRLIEPTTSVLSYWSSYLSSSCNTR